MTVGFDEISYNINENSSDTQICVSILSGSLADNRNVKVTLQSEDATATGNLVQIVLRLSFAKFF